MSIAKPLLSALILTVFFALLYGVAFNVTGEMFELDNLLMASSASIGRTFQFGAFGDLLKEYVNLLNSHSGPWSAFWFIFWGTIQTLCSLVLLFLFALAVRRRFQIS